MALKKVNLEDYNWEYIHGVGEYEGTPHMNDYPNIGMDEDGNFVSLSFDGNSTIRGTNAEFLMSEFAEDEWNKCANDLFYFAETYCKITVLGAENPIQVIKLRPYQKDYLQILLDNRFIISTQSRRAGKSVSTLIYMLWNICFKTSYLAGYTANTAKLTKASMKMFQNMYCMLPPFLQKNVETWNMSEIIFDDKAKMMTSVMNGNSFRGEALDFLIVDESAFVDKSKWDDFEDSVMPTLATSKKSQIVQISTPNGFNHFYDIWTEAKKGLNGYVHFLVTWEQIDIYDHEWKDSELKRIGPVKFARNYSCVTGDTEIDLLIKEQEVKMTIEELKLFMM